MTHTYLLVLAGGDLLQEVGDALALGAAEAQRLEEVQHMLARAVVHLQQSCLSNWLRFCLNESALYQTGR